MRRWFPLLSLLAVILVCSALSRFVGCDPEEPAPEPPPPPSLPRSVDGLQWRLEGRTTDEVLTLLGPPDHDSGEVGGVRTLTYHNRIDPSERNAGTSISLWLVNGRVEVVMP